MAFPSVLNKRQRRIRFTQAGVDKLKMELNELAQKRKLAVEELRKGREMGDLSENGYYKEAKAKLSFIDSRIRLFTGELNRSVVVNNTSDMADIGNLVTVSDGKEEITYQLVGDTEAAPRQKKVSLYSPVGKALVGKRAGDLITLVVPMGTLSYTVLKVE